MTSSLTRTLAGITVAISAAALATTVTSVVAPVAAQASTVGGQITRSEVIARAQSWLNQGIVYNQGGSHPDPQGRLYRTDCSGYVSMAWHLPTSRVTYDASVGNLGGSDITDPITKDQLKAGDLMMASGTDGHAVLFEGWADAGHSSYTAYEFGSTPVKHRTITYPYDPSDGRTFRPYHYRNVIDDPIPPPPPVNDGVGVSVSGDFNGDGRADMVMVYHHGDGSIGLFTSLADTNGGLGAFTIGATIPAASVWDWNAFTTVTGDVNGDGRTDLTVLYHHADGSLTVHTALADASGHVGMFGSAVLTVPASAGWDFHALRLLGGDVNGDGRSDLIMLYHHTDGSIGLYTALTTTTGGMEAFTIGATIPAASVWDWNAFTTVTGDVNGDGRTDLTVLYHHADGSFTVHTALSDASGRVGTFGLPILTVPGSAGWDPHAIRLAGGDFNGDGRADVGMLYHQLDGSIGLYTALTTPTGGMGAFTIGATVPAASVWDWNAFTPVTGDLTGDHRTDLAIMYHHTDGSFTLHTAPTDTTGHLGMFGLPTTTIPATAGWDPTAIRLP
jgi:hypothetical protein